MQTTPLPKYKHRRVTTSTWRFMTNSRDCLPQVVLPDSLCVHRAILRAARSRGIRTTRSSQGWDPCASRLTPAPPPAFTRSPPATTFVHSPPKRSSPYATSLCRYSSLVYSRRSFFWLSAPRSSLLRSLRTNTTASTPSAAIMPRTSHSAEPTWRNALTIRASRTLRSAKTRVAVLITIATSCVRLRFACQECATDTCDLLDRRSEHPRK